MTMKIDEFTEIIQEVCNNDTKGVLILRTTNDGKMHFYEYGEIAFLEKLGLLSAYKHDIMQEPYNELYEQENAGFIAH